VVRKQAEVPVKERLSRERIVDCAIALADAEGLEAVTIRRLAQDQGVTPMALYWHFKDKELLLNGIAERLLSEVVLPETVLPETVLPETVLPEVAGGSWDERFRGLLSALMDVLRAHPAAAELLRNRFMLSEPGLNLTEYALGLLREGGFDPEQAAQVASHALSSIVLLVTTEPGVQVGEEAAEREQRLRTKRATFQTLSPERYPYLLDSAEAFTVCSSVPAYFELGLDLFMSGVRGVQRTAAG
jgi:TetR/AcrR family tetracycline transcriptional repressor